MEDMFTESLGPIDLLFAVLGVATAFKVALAGGESEGVSTLGSDD